MKSWKYYSTIVGLLFSSVSYVAAQTAYDFSGGFGTARVKSNGSGIYNGNDTNAFQSCNVAPGTSNCMATPSLGGFFLGVSGSVMLSKQFGFGGELNFQPVTRNYGPLEYRQMFYDFNGIYSPIHRDRYALELQGGLGGTSTRFSYSEKSCIGTALCSSSSESLGSANHIQLHMGAGFKYFVNDYLFIRPQFDLHYIPNFTEQFGRNIVPRATIWIGFSRRTS